VSSTDELRITDAAGNEIPSAVRELTRWRTIAAGGPESVRAALFYVNVSFATRAAGTLRVAFGTPRTLELAGAQPAVDTLWTSITNGPDPDEYPASDAVREPNVYVTLPADWLGQSLLRARTMPVGSSADFDWWDSALVNFAATVLRASSQEIRCHFPSPLAPTLFCG